MLNEKIKSLRKANGLTQEDLAEKLCVSRQAITKWETGLGTPDLSNLEALSKLFGVSIDQLLSDEEVINQENISRTEFDIFGNSDFCLDVGVARSLDVSFADIEKVIVEVRSDLPKEEHNLAKVKLTEGKHVDLLVVEYKTDKKFLSVKADKASSKLISRDHLFIKMVLPLSLANHVELQGDLQELYIHDYAVNKHLEFDGKVRKAIIRNIKGHFELTSGADMEVFYDGSMEQLDINQLKCVSTLTLDKEAVVDVYNKGRACKVLFDGYTNHPDSTNKVELNGYKSELTVR